MMQLKFKHNIFKCCNESIFYKSFEISFLYFILIYIKIYKNFSAKYNTENKENYRKRLVKDIKVFLKKKKK